MGNHLSAKTDDTLGNTTLERIIQNTLAENTNIKKRACCLQQEHDSQNYYINVRFPADTREHTNVPTKHWDKWSKTFVTKKILVPKNSCPSGFSHNDDNRQDNCDTLYKSECNNYYNDLITQNSKDWIAMRKADDCIPSIATKIRRHKWSNGDKIGLIANIKNNKGYLTDDMRVLLGQNFSINLSNLEPESYSNIVVNNLYDCNRWGGLYKSSDIPHLQEYCKKTEVDSYKQKCSEMGLSVSQCTSKYVEDFEKKCSQQGLIGITRKGLNTNCTKFNDYFYDKFAKLHKPNDEWTMDSVIEILDDCNNHNLDNTLNHSGEIGQSNFKIITECTNEALQEKKDAIIANASAAEALKLRCKGKKLYESCSNNDITALNEECNSYGIKDTDCDKEVLDSFKYRCNTQYSDLKDNRICNTTMVDKFKIWCQEHNELGCTSNIRADIARRCNAVDMLNVSSDEGGYYDALLKCKGTELRAEEARIKQAQLDAMQDTGEQTLQNTEAIQETLVDIESKLDEELSRPDISLNMQDVHMEAGAMINLKAIGEQTINRADNMMIVNPPQPSTNDSASTTVVGTESGSAGVLNSDGNSQIVGGVSVPPQIELPPIAEVKPKQPFKFPTSMEVYNEMTPENKEKVQAIISGGIGLATFLFL